MYECGGRQCVCVCVCMTVGGGGCVCVCVVCVYDCGGRDLHKNKPY